MIARRIALLGALLAVGGAWLYQYFQVRAERAADSARMTAAALRQQQRIIEAFHGEPKRDGLDWLIPTTFPRPASGWRAAEKAFYEHLLSKGTFDVLVVPFQVQANAIDRSSRSLMTAQLATAIAAAQKSRVPDPYLVSRALGDSERRFNPQDVYRLANKLGVRKVVWAFVGYETQGDMRLTIRSQAREASAVLSAQAPFQARSFEKIPFSDEHPPIAAYENLLPEILKALGITPPVGAATKPANSAEAVSLPASPIAMTKDAPDAVRDAYYLQLLAALTPNSADRAKERLIEKSLLAISGISPDSPSYRFLKSRALLQMGLRVAAIKALGAPQAAEERQLLAVLNGNLPDAESLAAEIKPGINALLSSLDLNVLRSAYGVASQAKSTADADALNRPGMVWQFLAMRAMTDWDVWSQHDNARLKQLLDHEFPVSGFSLEELVRGATSVGNAAELETIVNLSVLNHVRRHLEAEPTGWCCAPLEARPTALDYLDLLEGIGTDNLVRRARFLLETQGSPEAALEFVTRLEGAYKDHPQLTLVRSQAEYDLGKRTQGAAREGYLKAAYVNAVNAWFWEQGQTVTAAAAWDSITEHGRTDFGHLGNWFASDYPYRGFYSPWQEGQGDPTIRNAQAGVRNSAYHFYPISYLHHVLVKVERRPDKFAEVLLSIEGRFRGNPALAIMKAEASAASGDLPAAVVHYRESIAAQPGHWDSYMALGKLLFEDGQTAKAAEIFAAYPGFKKGSNENAVGVSNRASAAGSVFFWSGNFAQAMPFYRIAADLRTGSDASMQCAIRIALMDGDYLTSAMGSLERARRYSSAFAYRDYFGLLHSMGHSRQAWDGFNVLAGQMDRPQLWETALVGHRIAGLSEKQVADWAAQDAMRGAGQLYGYASMHLLRAGVTDRVPTSELASLIAAIERPVWKVDDGYGHVVRPSRDGQTELVLGPNSPATGSSLPGGVFQKSKKEKVKSDLVHFAEAYRSMRRGDFSSASTILQSAASLYDVRNVQMGYLLPYLAFAAAKVGKVDAVDAHLAKFSTEERRFDYFLAKAAVAGLSGNIPESLDFLKLALHRRPFTEHRPLFTEYQFAEISEWLYEATRDARFRNVALSWARQNQTFQPWFAWAYAMEAKLTTNAEHRRRAIAMAYYLDRGSERLASIPAAEVKAAVKEYTNRNPFTRTQSPARRDST